MFFFEDRDSRQVDQESKRTEPTKRCIIKASRATFFNQYSPMSSPPSTLNPTLWEFAAYNIVNTYHLNWCRCHDRIHLSPGIRRPALFTLRNHYVSSFTKICLDQKRRSFNQSVLSLAVSMPRAHGSILSSPHILEEVEAAALEAMVEASKQRLLHAQTLELEKGHLASPP